MTVGGFAGLGIVLYEVRDLRPHLDAADFQTIHYKFKKITIGFWPRDRIMRFTAKYMKDAIV